jgi:hypothetical protein
MIINSYIFGSSVSDADAQAFITAAAITDNTQKNAINNLVINLKAAGIWSKMKAVYPMVGGTASSHKWNLKDPRDLDAAFRLTFTGGWIHASTGAKPNGTNAYADTFLTPSVSLSQNSTHVSYYTRTNSNNTEVEIGSSTANNAADNKIVLEIRTSGVSYYNVNAQETYISHVDSDSRSLYIANRTASNVVNGWKNGTSLATGTVASTGLSTAKIYLGAFNQNITTAFYSVKECSFASIGDGLLDNEAIVLNQIVEGYQYELSRNINPVNANYYNTAYNNETNAFLYSSQITDNTQKSAVNTLVNNLKTAGIWTKMKAVYPFIGGTASTHKWNLINPQDTNAAYRLTFNGGWTHSSTGALPNGTNGYADTFFNLSTGFTSANKGSVGGYWRTALPNTGYFFAVNAPVGGNNSRFWIRNAGVLNKDHYAGGITVLRDTTATDYSGFSAMCRRSTTDMFAIKRDGTYITLATSVTIGFSNSTLPFAAQNQSGVYGSFSNAEIALGYISDDITQAEMTSLRTAVVTFQTTISRQI